MWRWVQLENLPGLELHRLDLTDAGRAGAAFREARAGERAAPFDAVVNLAARAGVRASVENPRVYVEANVTGALNVLEMCREFGVKKFVLASTSSLYGKEHPTPYREEMNTDRQLSPYAATKKAAEAMAYTYHFLHGIDVSVLRYFTVYGPAGRPDMTPLRFVQRIREGRAITIFGDGSQSRDFTYVDDIARGTIAALRPVGYEAFNLGSDEPLKLSEMIGTDRGVDGAEGEDRVPAVASGRHAGDLGRYFQGAQGAGVEATDEFPTGPGKSRGVVREKSRLGLADQHRLIRKLLSAMAVAAEMEVDARPVVAEDRNRRVPDHNNRAARRSRAADNWRRDPRLEPSSRARFPRP